MNRATATVARSVARRYYRSALLWGGGFGLLVVSSVTGYSSAYPDVKDRLQLAASLGNNPGVRALFGEARHLETVGGFTVWRTTVLVMLAGGIWGLLTATKALRGEEDAGRAELLLAGPLTRRQGTQATMAGLAAVLAAFFAVLAVVTVAAGRGGNYFSISSGLWFALTLTLGPAVFFALGALASQIAPTRRAASTLAGVAFGAAYVVRVIADSGSKSRWLSWLTPFGWVERMRALTGTDVAPLVPLVLSIAVLVAATLWFSERRDIGGALLPDRPTADPHTSLLGSPSGLAIRLWRGTAIGWAIGVALMAAIFGVISKSISDAVGSNQGVADVFARLGAGQFTARSYLGVTFIFLSALLGVTAANFIASNRSEEADGQLDNVVVRPVSALRWFVVRVAIAAVIVLVLGVLAGLGGWLGIVAEDAGVGFGRMVLAGLNLVPPALFVLGVGALAHGVAPRFAAPAAYAVVAWSFLLEFVGAIVNANHWILDTSLMHHLAPVPATDPHWSTWLTLTALGLVGAAIGAFAFQRRDLAAA